MSTTHTEDDTEREAAPGSVLDLIGKIRDEVETDDEPLVITLGAYEDRVALRFDYPDGGFAQIRRSLGVGQKPTRRAQQDDEQELNAMADLMVACCSGVVEVIKGKPEAEWPSVEPDGKTLRINGTLAELFKIEVPAEVKKHRGRFILRNVYSPHAARTGVFRGDPVLLADGIEVNRWLEAGGVRVAERLPGE